MTSKPRVQADGPDPGEVRGQVERMAVSDVLRTSPQLVAFLRFVVNATLRGQSDRIKGYTIGIEVLGRDKDFDPQIDPIVRVEATRLRRAIERYYAGPGAGDEVIIALPRGSYVPSFRRRSAAHTGGAAQRAGEKTAERLPAGNGMPTLRIAPFVVVGAPPADGLCAARLNGRLTEAFALFDAINIVSGAGPGGTNNNAPPRSDYRLDGTLDFHAGDTVNIRFKLIDEASATVIFSRIYEQARVIDGEVATQEEIILDLASAIIQPFGIIQSNERARQLASESGDPRYRCIIETAQALRSADPAEHVRARNCLERLTALDPGFAVGFSLLAAIYYREHVFGYGAQAGDPPALDRALIVARRGIELKPEGARGYHLLFVVLFARGEIDAAFAAAEKAIALNRYDMMLQSDYGGRLIFAGQVDRGLDILERAQQRGAIRPSWHHFYLFLGHYLNGNLAEARHHANQLTSETFALTHLACALVAYAEGKAKETRAALARLVALQPGWEMDARAEIARVIQAPPVVARLADDLAAAGLASARPR